MGQSTPSPRKRNTELKLTIAVFESLLDSYRGMRERLLERRRGATDHVMVEIDERLAVNQRTLDSLARAIECLRQQQQLPEFGGSSSASAQPPDRA